MIVAYGGFHASLVEYSTDVSYVNYAHYVLFHCKYLGMDQFIFKDHKSIRFNSIINNRLLMPNNCYIILVNQMINGPHKFLYDVTKRIWIEHCNIFSYDALK